MLKGKPTYAKIRKLIKL